MYEKLLKKLYIIETILIVTAFVTALVGLGTGMSPYWIYGSFVSIGASMLVHLYWYLVSKKLPS